MSRVAHERVPRAGAARIAGGFFDLLDAAEQPQCLKPRLPAREASRLQALDFAIQMQLQLFAEI